MIIRKSHEFGSKEVGHTVSLNLTLENRCTVRILYSREQNSVHNGMVCTEQHTFVNRLTGGHMVLE